MSREDIPWLVLVILFLVGGLVAGQRFVIPESDQALPEPDGTGRDFRQWFWDSRSLDLAVQVGLVFVGALSMAALLPRGREDR